MAEVTIVEVIMTEVVMAEDRTVEATGQEAGLESRLRPLRTRALMLVSSWVSPSGSLLPSSPSLEELSSTNTDTEPCPLMSEEKNDLDLKYFDTIKIKLSLNMTRTYFMTQTSCKQMLLHLDKQSGPPIL